MSIIELGQSVIYLIEVVAFVFLGKWILGLIANYSIKNEFTQKDNLAICVSSVGYMAGISIIATSAASGEDLPFLINLMEIATYGGLGIALLLISRLINDRFILRKFCIRKELLEDKNAGTGAVLFGTYIGSAFLIAGATVGEGGGPITVIAFFLLGQIIMILFSHIYQIITPFDLHDEIEKDNVAAGVAFGGTYIAIGILLFKALQNDFIGWSENLITFGFYSLLGVLLLPMIRFFFVHFFVSGVNLNDEISKDQNVGIAIIEATMSILASTWIYFLI